MSWNQTPNTVWWALETSISAGSLSALGDTLPSPKGGARPKGSRNDIFDYADDAELEEDEEQLANWVMEHASRGILRWVAMATLTSRLAYRSSSPTLSQWPKTFSDLVTDLLCFTRPTGFLISASPVIGCAWFQMEPQVCTSSTGHAGAWSVLA